MIHRATEGDRVARVFLGGLGVGMILRSDRRRGRPRDVAYRQGPEALLRNPKRTEEECRTSKREANVIASLDRMLRRILVARYPWPRVIAIDRMAVPEALWDNRRSPRCTPGSDSSRSPRDPTVTIRHLPRNWYGFPAIPGKFPGYSRDTPGNFHDRPLLPRAG
jgi:hypothetical protein